MLYPVVMGCVIYFAPPFFARWLSREMSVAYRPVSRSWRLWALGSLVVAIVVDKYFHTMASNFVLHALGGGVVASLVYAYVVSCLGLKLHWKLELLLLVAFVSTLGTLNELAEFAMETVGLGTFSFDAQDTWRDLLANTSGGLLGWLLTRPFRRS